MAVTVTGKEATSGAWADVEVGVYEATLKSIESAPSAFDPGTERIQLAYELDGMQDDSGEPITMRYWCNAVLSPKSSLAAVIEAHGSSWGVGQAFEVDSLIGTKARLMVGRKTPQGKTEEIAFVQSVVPLAKAAGKAAPKAATKAAPASTAAPEAQEACRKCGAPVSVYDDDGTPWCEKHAD